MNSFRVSLCASRANLFVIALGESVTVDPFENTFKAGLLAQLIALSCKLVVPLLQIKDFLYPLANLFVKVGILRFVDELENINAFTDETHTDPP
jgi:hypothetical protein